TAGAVIKVRSSTISITVDGQEPFFDVIKAERLPHHYEETKAIVEGDSSEKIECLTVLNATSAYVSREGPLETLESAKASSD
ncbi:hypothetical protein HAX54_005245, partial [Datura stramonium]|nr:hypothetical protein [Datura stramonium]